MKGLVTGINGQLGYSAIKECAESINTYAVIHCTEDTYINLAEENEDLCRKVKAISVRGIAMYAKKLDIINDQTGLPTYTNDLDKASVDIIESDKYSIYNVTNESFCSWYEFAKKNFNISKINIDDVAICASEYTQKTNGLMNSKMIKEDLSNNRLKRLRNWKYSAREC